MDTDLESILANPNIDLAALTVFDRPPLSSDAKQSSHLADNPPNRGISKTTNRLSKGKFKAISLFSDKEDSLTDIPISISEGTWEDLRALRARHPKPESR